MIRKALFDQPSKTSPEEKLGRLEAVKATIMSMLEDLRVLSLDPDCDVEALSSALTDIEKELRFLRQSFMLSGVATTTENADEDFSPYTKDGRKKLILCVELKRFFESQTEAHRETGVNAGNIYLVLTGKNRTAGGYHWMYIDPDIIKFKEKRQ